MLNELTAIITRDLRALRREVEAFPDDSSLWTTPPGVTNSTGTLALHLVGNLRHFVGAQLGKDGYVRNRNAEFETRGLSRAEVVAKIDEAIAAVTAALPNVKPAALEDEMPDTLGGNRVRAGDWLIHLISHLGYHLGQADYHRRLVTGNGATVNTMAIGELSSARKA